MLEREFPVQSKIHSGSKQISPSKEQMREGRYSSGVSPMPSTQSPVDGSINTVIRANVGQGGRDAAAMISGSAICQQDSKESYLSGNGNVRFYNNYVCPHLRMEY